jgi:thiamine-monophosphate kinase
VGDLGHLLERSGVGACVNAADVPRSDTLRGIEPGLQQRCVLAGGDDYELLFSAPPMERMVIEAAGRNCCVAVTRIGTMVAEPGIRWVGEGGIDATLGGFDHFAGAPES